MIKLIVPIYYTFERKTKKDKTIMVGLNWYRNAHYRESNQVKKYYYGFVYKILYKLKFPRLKGKVRVDYKIYLKRRGSDGGNVRSIIEKFVLDALVVVGTIDEDKFDVVVGDSSEYYLDKNNPRCEITIRRVK